jgi:hypothetical protein
MLSPLSLIIFMYVMRVINRTFVEEVSRRRKKTRTREMHSETAICRLHKQNTFYWNFFPLFGMSLDEVTDALSTRKISQFEHEIPHFSQKTAETNFNPVFPLRISLQSCENFVHSRAAIFFTPEQRNFVIPLEPSLKSLIYVF